MEYGVWVLVLVSSCLGKESLQRTYLLASTSALDKPRPSSRPSLMRVMGVKPVVVWDRWMSPLTEAIDVPSHVKEYKGYST